jgi:hypothetical protein
MVTLLNNERSFLEHHAVSRPDILPGKKKLEALA